jgi:peptidoglycan/LPS O-acetylase OafA/YrhL
VHTASSKQHRFHLLDAIRGIAALLVVAYHAPPDFGRLMPFRSGFLAVDLFFVLSGFVIALSYERRLREGFSFRNFVAARLIRIYPAYLLGTLFAIIAGVATAHLLSSHGFLWEILLGLLLLPDVFHGGKVAVYSLDFPAWSLLCEFISNTGYAVLVLWRGAGEWLLYLVIGASAIFMLVWVHGSGTVDSGSILQTFPMGLARVGYSFGAGVLVFRYFHAQRRERLTGPSSWLLAGAICFVVVTALATAMTKSPAAQIVTVLLIFPVLIYLGALTSMTGRLSKVASFLGDTSYPIYLLHIPFFTLFRGRNFHQTALNHQSAKPVIALFSLSVLLALSWVAAKWFDLPIRRYLTASYNQRLRYAT